MAKKIPSKKASWIPKRDWDRLMAELKNIRLAQIIADMKPTFIVQVGDPFDLSKCSKEFQDHFEKKFPVIKWP